MIVSVCEPRIGLTAAVLASGLPEPEGPAAVAPLEGGPRTIGEVNPAAEGVGIRDGMEVTTALETCPSLELLPPDPAGLDSAWEVVLTSLEELGAEVEAERPGEAFFDPAPLIGINGGLDGLVGDVFRVLDGRAMVGVGPTRLAAITSLAPSPDSLEPVAESRLNRHLDDLPTTVLRGRIPGGEMFEILDRLGIRTLGRLRDLSAGALADRFGDAGLEALHMACGKEPPLRPRKARVGIEARLDLEAMGVGDRLPAVTELASGIIASRLEEAGLLARALRLEVGLEVGGSLDRDIVPRVPTRSATTIALLTRGELGSLPCLASSLTLKAPETTPELPDQENLFEDPAADRGGRLAEAARQVGVAAGDQALLRVVEVDPESRLPERRIVLVPLVEAGE